MAACVVGFGGFQQIGADRHGRGGADQRRGRRPCRDAAPRSPVAISEPIEWPISRAFAAPAAVISAAVQSGHLGDRRERLAGGAAVARQIGRQHGIAVMGEPAAVQRPGRRVEAGAVDHHHRGELRVERLAAGRDEGVGAVDGSCMAQVLCEARSAWPRSSMISSAVSMPTDSRTSSSPIPAALSCSASIC